MAASVSRASAEVLVGQTVGHGRDPGRELPQGWRRIDDRSPFIGWE
jgi:hypothetical protein